MPRNRRTGMAPIPDHLDRMLSPEQEETLVKAELYGWKVKFVRRPMIVLVNEDGSTLGVLEENGNLKLDTKVRERGEGTESTELPRGAGKGRLLT